MLSLSNYNGKTLQQAQGKCLFELELETVKQTV